MPEVLLADDNPSDVYLIREALREHAVDCVLHVVTDGKDALGAISGETGAPSISLIILDLNLPRTSGFAVLERVRASRKCNRKPVVVFSSSDAEEDREQARRLGASYYLRKPSTLKDLMSIGEVLKKILAG